MRLPPLSAVCLFAGLMSGLTASTLLVAPGALTSWHWKAGNAEPPATWTGPEFDDASWKAGPAPLGYGEDNMGTNLPETDAAGRKVLAAYFRRSFEVEKPTAIGSLALRLRRDDGAAVYLNGTEVARSNLPDGPLTAATAANSALGGEEESEFVEFSLPTNALKPGRNLLAVEVHQVDARSSDLAFDLSLTAYAQGEKAAKTASDPIAAALKALRANNVKEAVRLLESVLFEDPRYTDAMVLLGLQIYAEGLGRPEKGLPYLAKAYEAKPGDMEVVRAYIRGHVLARDGLAVTPEKRPIPDKVDPAWADLAETPAWPDRSARLSREKLLEDLDYLELMMVNCYSYLDRRGADWKAALDNFRAGLGKETGTGTFQLRLERFLTVFGDPHTRLSDPNPTLPRGGAAALFAEIGGRVIAVTPDRSDYLAPDCPFVVEMDGKPVKDWLNAAEADIPKASPQFQRRAGAEALGRTTYLRWRLGLAQTSSCQIKVTSADGSKSATVTVPVGQAARGGTWPATATKKLDQLGYLRLTSMESGPEFVKGLNETMASFRDTRGLILDVRDNGGGSQVALLTLMPYFVDEVSGLQVVNVAAYRLPVRLPKPNPEGFLGMHGRALHPVTSDVWTVEQKETLTRFLSGWKPAWKLPSDLFSDWHLMAVSHATNPAAYRYTKPVVVLLDTGCFSATDNFLGAFKGLPGVTLLGTASGGGSGRMQDYTLPNSGLSLTLCQMASFNAKTAQTYDGNGVLPDVVLEPVPADFLADQGDTLLEAAKARLNGGK